MAELLLLIDDAQRILAGDSSAAGRLRSQVERISRTPRTTVLLLGVRGLELELVARCIHLRSSGQGAFVPVSSQALSNKPAQVDAFSCSGGLAERASGGTLFLDEVADLDLGLQSDLLRRLEDRLQPSAAVSTGKALEPRVVASTAEDLEARVLAGSFRSDLFYRLNVLTIRIPSLADRAEDLEALAEGILSRLSEKLGTKRMLAADALEQLRAHSWPGNLLELEAVLTQALLAGSGPWIGPEQLQLGPGTPKSSHSAPQEPCVRSIRASEEALIRRVLREEAGNRSSTARALGINRTTLYNKLRQYGIA